MPCQILASAVPTVLTRGILNKASHKKKNSSDLIPLRRQFYFLVRAPLMITVVSPTAHCDEVRSRDMFTDSRKGADDQ